MQLVLNIFANYYKHVQQLQHSTETLRDGRGPRVQRASTSISRRPRGYRETGNVRPEAQE